MVARGGLGGLGGVGETVLPLLVLVVFSVSWGLVHYRDGTPLLALALLAPLALGMLSSGFVRMLLGRDRGGCVAVAGGGVGVFLVMFVLSALVSELVGSPLMTDGAAVARGEPGGPPGYSMIQMTLSLLMGVVGCGIGTLALRHYVVQDLPQPDEDTEDLQDDDDVDVDYTTEPEELVCLLTNQVIKRDHDRYVVCHNKLNVSQVCHAVYLKDYVHLLDGRCRRCFQALRSRDLEGMGVG
ncbi:MAG TPA: hypothetical protein DIU15_10215 [Deltaproteobacteria bacterium]|nr:hypothetical protein [Deltaproteobacteria bacterium]HCP46408.1 hypothetical protein [Deltaproteobacteria bacterium]